MRGHPLGCAAAETRSAQPQRQPARLIRILIVEDEPKTAAYLRKRLTESGFIADVAEAGDDGLARVLALDYDLIILDAMLPRRDGWSVLEELRRRGRRMPVLFLTARSAVPDRVKGLELGADDYLVKPYAFTELLARGVFLKPTDLDGLVHEVRALLAVSRSRRGAS